MLNNPVHVDVMLEVCCPAKSSTISQPVTSESLKARPALVTLPVLGSTHVGFGHAAFAPGLNHLVENSGQVFPRGVAFAVRLDGGVREEHGEGDHAFVQVVHQSGDFAEQSFPNFAT